MAGPPPHGGSSDWTEHKAGDGRTYWYNAKTGSSVWSKPAELLSARERADLTTQWREHTAADGRPYYSNVTTNETRWQLPEELRVAREAAERAEAVLAVAQPVAPVAPVMVPLRPPMPPVAAPYPVGPAPVGVSPPMPVVRMRSAHEVLGALPPGPVPLGAPAYATEDDAKAAFRQLLVDSAIGADDSWESAMVRIIKDPRYGALPSLAKKKAVFGDYVAQRLKAEREERRAKEQAAREAVMAAVREALTAGTLTTDARVRDVDRVLAGDPRWKDAMQSGVLDARQRDAAATEALEEAASQAREKRKAARDAAVAALRSALDTAPGVTHETPWRAAMDALGEPPGSLWVTSLSKAERLEAFGDWVRDGERAAAEAAALAREAQRRSEREARAAFCALLWQCVSDGRLTARTSWKEFAKRVADEPAYAAINGNVGGSRPRELFEDVVDELGDTLSADAVAVTAALGDRVDAALEASVEAVSSMLTAAGGRAAGVSAANLGIILGDMRAAKQEKAERAIRKARRAADDFAAMLRSKPLPVGASWEAVRPEIAREPAFGALTDETLRKQLYEAHAAALVASGAEPGEVMALTSSRHRGKDDRHRDRKRRRSRSRSARREGGKKSRRRRTPSSSSSSDSESSGSDSSYSSSSDSRDKRRGTRKGRERDKKRDADR